ncbi:hypothetical protein [Vibrio cholerae]|uniref:hypothetical protein n=1 Tax=Vibrio cholerae TaxID=666 RepID=UPI000B48E312|nr:hypothetical protein [Vibrio cholerae]ELL3753173.1 hypothetical protein [Vibrio cholerae]MDV2401160.1 hypothetical protein [Vibrio cholerae]TYW30898.1 hypothetical protein FY537_15395 [Vibrio cholerae]
MQNETLQEQPGTKKEPSLQPKAYTKRDFFGAIAVGIYLLLLLIPSIGYWYMITTNAPPPWVVSIKQVIECMLVAVSGGVLYCLRAVYLSYSVRKQWDEVWVVWYLLRPFASGLMGFATYLIISAGLVAIGSPSAEHPEKLLYALSFFAGLNVDGFLKKFEGQVSNSVKVKESRQTQGL